MVQWVGCDEVTWEPKSFIAPELIEAFEKQQEQQGAGEPAAEEPAADVPVRPVSPAGEKRARTEGSALSPSAKSPDPKR